jgi:hypothetical protein
MTRIDTKNVEAEVECSLITFEMIQNIENQKVSLQEQN